MYIFSKIWLTHWWFTIIWTFPKLATMSRFLPRWFRRCFGIGFAYNHNEIVPGVNREEFIARVIVLVPHIRNLHSHQVDTVQNEAPSAPPMSITFHTYDNPLCHAMPSCHQDIESATECAICFDPMCVDTEETLQCKHKFCKNCIHTWKKLHAAATCPLCREQIVVNTCCSTSHAHSDDSNYINYHVRW
jgi:hypothetical protein